MTGTFTGAALLRKEDPRLITGQGRYTDDITLPRMLHVALVRATQIGRIRGVDVAEAIDRPGVVAAFTGEDFAESFVGPLPLAWPVTEDIKVPEHWPVTRDVARYVGDVLAVVVAGDRSAAADAIESVQIDYEAVASGNRHGSGPRCGRAARTRESRNERVLYVGPQDR